MASYVRIYCWITCQEFLFLFFFLGVLKVWLPYLRCQSFWIKFYMKVLKAHETLHWFQKVHHNIDIYHNIYYVFMYTTYVCICIYIYNVLILTWMSELWRKRERNRDPPLSGSLSKWPLNQSWPGRNCATSFFQINHKDYRAQGFWSSSATFPAIRNELDLEV